MRLSKTLQNQVEHAKHLIPPIGMELDTLQRITCKLEVKPGGEIKLSITDANTLNTIWLTPAATVLLRDFLNVHFPTG